MTGILFDLDGTLLDTLEDLADAVNFTMDHYGYPRRSLEEVRRFVGNGARRLIALAVPEGADAEAAFQTFKAYYDAHCRIKTRPYPGILQVLTELAAEYPVAIVSNKPDSAVKSLCADYFPGIYALGESPECPRKPAPDMVRRAMEIIGVDRCVYVGDSEVDVATGRNSGMPCYACTWGYRDTDVLLAAGADILVDSAEELGRMLRCGEATARMLTLLKRRRSVRKFEDRPVEEEKLQALLSAALLVPTSRSLNEVEYHAVTDRKVIDFLAACKAHGAGPLKTAPLALVLTADESKADTWIEDSSLAAITLQLMAEELGLASCWIQMHMRKDEGEFDAEENVSRVLGLPKGSRCVCVLAIGYRAEEKDANRDPALSDPRIHRR